MSQRLERLAGRLSRVSAARYDNPHLRFGFHEPLSGERLATSAELISLAGHPLWAELGDERRRQLALREAAHVFSLNIAGERELMTGLAERLWTGARGPALCRYLQHMLHEENAHSVVFAGFCLQYVGKIFPDPARRLPRQYLPGEKEFLFWAQILIFEQIAVWFNRRQAADPELWAVTRRIHEYHAEDEGRHIAFGERCVTELWAELSPGWGEAGRSQVGSYLRRYVEYVLGRHVSADVYRELGLGSDPLALREVVLASPARQRVHEQAAQRSRRLLAQLDALGGPA